MKILIVFSMAAGLLAADGATPAAPAKAETAPAAALPAGIPAGAVQIGPNSYRFTRPDGKTWLYHTTPFGIMKGEEKPAPAAAEAQGMQGVKATVHGDTVTFEKVTPLGIFHWQKKKSDLNEMEQALCDHDNSRDAAAQD